MLGLLPQKKECYVYAAIDFEILDNMNNLKKTIIEYINDRDVKYMIDHETMQFKPLLLPSLNECDVLIYLCHISFCLGIGRTIDLNKLDLK